jgi:hypothetical protein
MFMLMIISRMKPQELMMEGLALTSLPRAKMALEFVLI